MDVLKIICIILIFIICIFCFSALLFHISAVNAQSPAVYIFAAITFAGILAIAFMIMSFFPKPPVSGDGTGHRDSISYFDGRALEWLGISILAFFMTVLSAGWAYPWARCMVERWRTDHTVISGRRLKFKGTGKSLFVNHLVWSLLSVVTFGVYGIMAGAEFEKWKAEQITSEPDTGKKPPVKPRTKFIIIALIILAIELGAGIFLVIMFYSEIQTFIASLLP